MFTQSERLHTLGSPYVLSPSLSFPVDLQNRPVIFRTFLLTRSFLPLLVYILPNSARLHFRPNLEARLLAHGHLQMNSLHPANEKQTAGNQAGRANQLEQLKEENRKSQRKGKDMKRRRRRRRRRVEEKQESNITK